jgi:hypothetical protein
VQFGEQHAAEHGHAATGQTFKPLLRRWDSEHPVHLIGNQQLHNLCNPVAGMPRLCALTPDLLLTSTQAIR